MHPYVHSLHTLTHEFGHAVGLWHSEIKDTSMGPPQSQASYWAAHDLMTIATIHSKSVKHLQTRDEIRSALGLPDDSEWNGFIDDTSTLSTPPDSTWIALEVLLKEQANSAR